MHITYYCRGYFNIVANVPVAAKAFVLNSLELAYSKANWRVRPYVSCCLFNKPELFSTWYTAGTMFKVDDINSIALYYQLVHSYSSGIYTNVLGLGYFISL